MKIALLSGALKNAGDFLIVERSKKLLMKMYPDCVIEEYTRSTGLEPNLDRFNENDVAVCAGGPGYLKDYYPKQMPLMSDLSDIKIPIFLMGMGWSGTDTMQDTVYSYLLGEGMKKFLDRVQSDTGLLGCRDWYSVNVLRNMGIQSGIMTGCPAWYDLDYVNQLHLSEQQKDFSKIKKICVSDAAYVNDFPQVEKIINFLKKNFSNAEIVCVYHRGTNMDEYTKPALAVQQKAYFDRIQSLGVRMEDISSGADGMSIYDDCGLHIGFRVHAHIYNLSRRNISILIEEDGRGGGVNDALGLCRISAWNRGVKGGELKAVENEYMLFQIEDELCNLIDTGFIRIENAFHAMNRYYDNMVKHLKVIQKAI